MRYEAEGFLNELDISHQLPHSLGVLRVQQEE